MGTPIINLPQTGDVISLEPDRNGIDDLLAVLGLHAIKEKPVAINGKVEVRPVSKISELIYLPTKAI